MAEGATATEVKAPAPTPEAPPPAPKPEQAPAGTGHQAEQRVATMLQEPHANVDAILHQVAEGKAFAGMDMADQLLKQALGPSTEVAAIDTNPLAGTPEADVSAAAEAITKEAAASAESSGEPRQAAETETPTASTELVLAEKPVQQEQADQHVQQSEMPQAAPEVSRAQQLIDMMGVSADASPGEIAEAAKKVFEGKDYADILGVSPDATADEIKAAKRKLFKDLHTDTNSDPRAEEALKLITVAKTNAEKKSTTQKNTEQTTETETPPAFTQGETYWTRVVMQPPVREALTVEEEPTEQAEEKDQLQELIEQKVKDLVAPDEAKELSEDLADEITAHPDLKEPVEEILEKVATDQNPIQDLEEQAKEIQEKITTTTETQTLPTKEIGALKIVLEIIQKLITALITAAGKMGVRAPQGTSATNTGQTAPVPQAVRPAQPAIERAPTPQTPGYEVTLERVTQEPATIKQPEIEARKQPALEAAPPRQAIEQAPQRTALEASPQAPAALPAAKE